MPGSVFGPRLGSEVAAVRRSSVLGPGSYLLIHCGFHVLPAVPPLLNGDYVWMTLEQWPQGKPGPLHPSWRVRTEHLAHCAELRGADINLLRIIFTWDGKINAFRTRTSTHASMPLPSLTRPPPTPGSIDYVSCVYRTRRGFPGNRIISSAKQCIRGKSGHPVCWPKAF